MTTQTNAPPHSRFSSRTYFLFIAFLTMGGIATSVYLSLSHYRNFTDIGYQSFCAVSRSLNCDTVSQSPYAIFGNVPVAVWGGLGYAFFFALLMVFRPQQEKLPGLSVLCPVAGLFSLISIALALVSSFWVHSYCLMCIASYGINFLLLIVTWMAQKRFGFGTYFSDLKMSVAYFNQKRGLFLFICLVFTTISLTAIFFYPKYWLYPTFTKNPHIAYGVTEDGSPWVGARNPVLTISEYTDYMCFQCGKMHSHLRRLVSQYPEKVRLVHRHFPLDHRVNPILTVPVHPNSGLISLFAIAAQESGRFWQVSDLLFRDARQKQTIDFNGIAREGGLDLSRIQERINDKRVIEKLEKDIRAGLKLRITGTPSYEINGNVYAGTIPEDIISRVTKGN